VLLSVDPGVNGCGCALWSDYGRLVAAKYVRVKKHADAVDQYRALAQNVRTTFDGADSLILEVPRVYQGSKQKGDPNDLVSLGVVVGLLVGVFGKPAKTVFPYEWKRQLPDAVCSARVMSRLDETERTVIELPGKTLAHNVLDAVGIGLHGVGRYLV
jgi:hypothetical protein